MLKHTFGYPSFQYFSRRKIEGSLKFKSYLLPGFAYAYSDDFVKKFSELFKQVFGFDLKLPPDQSDPHELYWLTSSYVAANAPMGFKSATHFLELYGFSRNTSMSFFIISLLPVFPGWNLSGKPSIFPSIWGQHLSNSWGWFLVMMGIGLTMYYNYTKLFRRQNDQLFRAFLISASEKASHTVEK